jgi:hypothetical protein
MFLKFWLNHNKVLKDMKKMTNKMISDFSEKPHTLGFFKNIDDYVQGLGEVKKELKAQVSYAVKRKFLWMWAYEKTPDGTLYLNVTLDRELKNPHFHNVTQVSKNRWNHQVEVKSLKIAESKWLQKLIKSGYEFASE